MQAARHLAAALGGLFLVLCPTSVYAGGVPPTLSEEQLIDAAIHASGVEDAREIEERRSAVLQAMSEIVDRLDLERPTVRGARRLHRMLHRSYLRTYVAEEDDLLQLVEHGRYNCLSGTLFYGLIARRLGYEPGMIKLPGHLLVRLEAGGRSLDVETTVADGFDFGYFASLRVAHEPGLTSRQLLEWPGSTAWSRQIAGPSWMLPLETAVGYAWLNRGWRALEEGQAADAARAVMEARPYLGQLVEREEAVTRILTRAFRSEYESGRFADAYRIARIDAALFPQRTTSRDRLLAAGLKRVEWLNEAGDPMGAHTVVLDVSSLIKTPSDLARFERRTCPLIAAAAVRHGRYDLAREAARRYTSAEPDLVEVLRLQAWIDERSGTTLSAADPSAVRPGLPYCPVEFD